MKLKLRDNPTKEEVEQAISENHIHINFVSPNSYEELFDKKKWMRTCPNTLKPNEYIYFNMNKEPELDELYGWFNYKEYYEKVANRLPDKANFLEIGTYHGASISYLGSLRQDLNLFSIDPFTSQGYMPWRHFKNIPNRAGYNMRNIKRFCKKIVLLDGFSDEFVGFFSDGFFDQIYIDGDHSYEQVSKDIKNYLPKVRAGGYISGHDYHEGGFPQIVRAVHENFEDVTRYEGTVWESKIG